MANPDNCPNCDNIYGNEPRKIPCGHIVCHKCCLDLFNKEDNTLICPACNDIHVFKSKNIFKKSLQQVPHAGFGKKTSIKAVSFQSTMPMEKASGAEKSASKEVKKAAANPPSAPPGAPLENSTPAAPTSSVPSSAPPPPPPPPPPAPVPTQPEPLLSSSKPTPVSGPTPLMSQKSSLPDFKSTLIKSKASTSNGTAPPSLFETIVPPPAPPQMSFATPSVSDAVIARCHSCANKCQVIVCDHCDHFVCLTCAEKHRTTAPTMTNTSINAPTVKVDTQGLTTKWQECQNKYKTLSQKLDQYNADRDQIEKELAVIRVAVEQRTRDAIQAIIDQRDKLVHRIDQHIDGDETANSIKHQTLVKEFRNIQNRLESAMNGEDIGAYTQDDFLRDIGQLQQRMNQRNDLIETHILKIPKISRYEPVAIEKLLGELRFNHQSVNDDPTSLTSSFWNNGHPKKQNGFTEHPSVSPTRTFNRFPPGVSSSPNHNNNPTKETNSVKPLMGETQVDHSIDDFEKFRRMAAHIHQMFNAPYSKVINAASTPSSADATQINGHHDKNTRTSSTTAPSKIATTGTLTKSWKIEHTAVPNFLCMTPSPTPKVFVVDKYGRVSVCSIPPKSIKPIESYTLFPPGTDECIESVVASSRYLIVYSRKKQDTMTGTMFFFTHECKQVPPLSGIHQNIPVHHILCDQNGNRLYCLDRMRCTIYYHTLPNNNGEIETCMKTRYDFIQFNPSFVASKMLQNDHILGFYVKNTCTVHLYDKQTAERIDEFKCEHFTDKFESWGIIAIRKDNTTLIFKVDECVDQEAVTRQHIVYEVNRLTKQVISQIQLTSVFGMILGPSNEIILGIRQTKDSGLVQCYVKK